MATGYLRGHVPASIAAVALSVLVLLVAASGGAGSPRAVVTGKTAVSTTATQDAIENLIRADLIRVPDRPFARLEALRLDLRDTRYCVRYDLDGAGGELCGLATASAAGPNFVTACFQQARIGEALPHACLDFPGTARGVSARPPHLLRARHGRHGTGGRGAARCL